MIKRGLIMATCVGALMATSSAKAETAYDAEGSLTPFIYYWTYLNAGTQYTIETKNLTSSSDTVLSCSTTTMGLCSNNSRPTTIPAASRRK